ncbi:MAG: RHS repeat protein, partial [Acidobacteria bacterium]
GSCPAAQCNPQIDQLTNRFATDQGYVYDESGSLIRDAAGRRYVYDGKSKQTEVRDAANNVIGRYFYDGDGKRVKKHVPSTGETTIFVYDASGRLVAEYSTIVANSTDAKVAYLTNDHLGSPRINTDANGNVTARHDYHPFGEEIGTLPALPGSPQPRTAALGYQSDSVKQKFTTYERDNETDLDYA